MQSPRIGDGKLFFSVRYHFLSQTRVNFLRKGLDFLVFLSIWTLLGTQWMLASFLVWSVDRHASVFETQSRDLNIRDASPGPLRGWPARLCRPWRGPGRAAASTPSPDSHLPGRYRRICYLLSPPSICFGPRHPAAGLASPRAYARTLLTGV